MGAVLPVSALTEKDRADLAFAVELGVDWVALSFVQRPEDLDEVRELAGRPVYLVAKLEKPSAVDRLDEIVAHSDAVMVARGDLGVEMAPEKVPTIQRRILRACRARRQAGDRGDADAGEHDRGADADPGRGLGRGDRGLRGRRRGDAVGGIGRRQVSRSRRCG